VKENPENPIDKWGAGQRARRKFAKDKNKKCGNVGRAEGRKVAKFGGRVVSCREKKQSEDKEGERYC